MTKTESQSGKRKVAEDIEDDDFISDNEAEDEKDV